jgi:hypothetical protein
MDPITILTAFIPVLSQGLRGLVNKWTGGAGAKPATVDEAIKLGDLDIRRLEALAKLDEASGTSQWVANVRGIQRPVAVALVLLTYVIVVGTPSSSMATMDMVANLASSAMFYLFGDRTLMAINGTKK